MMEPDIRIKTNEQGFCNRHYEMMLTRKRMLGMGLILESHLAEVEKKVAAKSLLGLPSAASLPKISKLNGDCYVCGRINKNLTAMISTAVYLFETDSVFRDKFKKTPYFCLPHYKAMLEYASKKISKRTFRDFYDVAHGIEENYAASLKSDVSWFCKKFDYRYDEEPWYNAKDSVYRSIKFLSGELGLDD